MPPPAEPGAGDRGCGSGCGGNRDGRNLAEAAYGDDGVDRSGHRRGGAYESRPQWLDGVNRSGHRPGRAYDPAFPDAVDTSGLCRGWADGEAPRHGGGWCATPAIDPEPDRTVLFHLPGQSLEEAVPVSAASLER